MMRSCVPQIDGAERYDFASGILTIWSNSGFDRNSDQHCKGSDAVRYGIAMQQARDASDYAKADEIAREWLHLYNVGTAKDRIVITAKHGDLVEHNSVICDPA